MPQVRPPSAILPSGPKETARFGCKIKSCAIRHLRGAFCTPSLIVRQLAALANLLPPMNSANPDKDLMKKIADIEEVCVWWASFAQENKRLAEKLAKSNQHLQRLRLERQYHTIL